MIIQCEQCRTKFRLDDSRVKEKGVKVRCAKCRHVFTVMKELPEPLQETAFGALLDQSTVTAAETAQPSSFEPQQQVPAASPGDEFDFSPAESKTEETPALGLPAETAPFAPFESQPEVQAQKAETAFDFSAPAEAIGTADASAWEAATFEMHQQEPPSAVMPDETFAFPAEEKEAPARVEESAAASTETEFLGFEFPEVVPKPAQEVSEPAPVPETIAAPQAPQAAAAFEIPPRVSAPREEPKPQAPPVPPPKEPAFAAEDELPPLSIPSRRKKSSLQAIMLAVLLLLLAGALFFYKDALLPLLPQGMKPAAPQQGKITVRSIDASFVKNENAGELLVITGEAVNESDTPREAIRVTGLVYGDNDKILASKSAYSGNVISKELLAVLPLDKIEAAMANQFGSALENMEVAPGKAIPFMVVIHNVPPGAKNFGAMQAGSSAVTAKKK